MADEPSEATGQAGGQAGREQLRPFRRLVGVIFAIAIVVGAFVILRGIIRHLDRMPSPESEEQPSVVDVRALRACAEDLERLEVRILQAAGAAFAEIPRAGEAQPDWEVLSKQFVVDRVAIEARCRLHQKSSDVAAAELKTAADEIDALVRAYQILHARHLEDDVPHGQAAREALRRAVEALSAR